MVGNVSRDAIAFIKSLLKSVIYKINLDHERNRLLNNRINNIESSLIRINNLGFKPKLIFDGGANKGDFTHFCTQLWPDAQIACFEVLPHRVVELQQLEQKNPNVKVFPVLLGQKNCDRIPFYELEGDAETASSILDATNSFNLPPKYHPMRTMNDVIAKDFNGQAPDLVKLDVQGYELEILKGVEENLAGIQVIIAELAVLELYQGTPLLSEVVQWFSQRNWETYDICGFWRRPLDLAMWNVDFMFVPRDHSLRQDKSYGDKQK
ncbi:FkbM family methyltransferase [Spirulina sp. 06S082]|uniref:FkbM family methyltransferase n=1 Tax=Spirulina sp. 06S082 TaxID=3110248 RepID=UPI002B21B0A8|nr:FkbM family methyltransferase [Spirulina sp. 06S082]MEA5467350.1 FkbM family methyltransferase [Spirulina sp. 06S082]